MKKIVKVQILLYIFLFILIFVCTHIMGCRPFEGDSFDYWKYGELLFESGRFNFCIDGFRGYIFPLYLGICNHYFGGVFGWEVTNSLQFALFFMYSCTFVL